jgi:hypothetical protein
MYDIVEWSITLTAPASAKAFSISYVFFSAEYDEWISSQYNDKFYIVLNAPLTTGGRDRVINYTSCRDSNAYYDFEGINCDTPSGKCCYIAINSAMSDCCWYPHFSEHVDYDTFISPACPGDPITDNTDISGTGYECALDVSEDLTQKGSSTGWLMTYWPINPGETFTLTFHIHDTADGNYDSQVILDAFTFYKDVDEESHGTIQID